MSLLSNNLWSCREECSQIDFKNKRINGQFNFSCSFTPTIKINNVNEGENVVENGSVKFKYRLEENVVYLPDCKIVPYKIQRDDCDYKLSFDESPIHSGKSLVYYLKEEGNNLAQSG